MSPLQSTLSARARGRRSGLAGARAPPRVPIGSSQRARASLRSQERAQPLPPDRALPSPGAQPTPNLARTLRLRKKKTRPSPPGAVRAATATPAPPPPLPPPRPHQQCLLDRDGRLRRHGARRGRGPAGLKGGGGARAARARCGARRRPRCTADADEEDQPPISNPLLLLIISISNIFYKYSLI